MGFGNKVHSLTPTFGQGIIPLTFHCDGAEFFQNTEYMVWSCGSLLASGDEAHLKVVEWVHAILYSTIPRRML